jgi:hypothetical protein
MVIDIGCLYRENTKDGITTITTAESAPYTKRILLLDCVEEIVSLSGLGCIF